MDPVSRAHLPPEDMPPATPEDGYINYGGGALQRGRFPKNVRITRAQVECERKLYHAIIVPKTERQDRARAAHFFTTFDSMVFTRAEAIPVYAYLVSTNLAPATAARYTASIQAAIEQYPSEFGGELDHEERRIFGHIIKFYKVEGVAAGTGRALPIPPEHARTIIHWCSNHPTLKRYGWALYVISTCGVRPTVLHEVRRKHFIPTQSRHGYYYLYVKAGWDKGLSNSHHAREVAGRGYEIIPLPPGLREYLLDESVPYSEHIFTKDMANKINAAIRACIKGLELNFDATSYSFRVMWMNEFFGRGEIYEKMRDAGHKSQAMTESYTKRMSEIAERRRAGKNRIKPDLPRRMAEMKARRELDLPSEDDFSIEGLPHAPTTATTLTRRKRSREDTTEFVPSPSPRWRPSMRR